jgi:hypothetical protein
VNLKFEHYRLEAAHCEAEAELATTPELRADWLRLAARWLSMIPHAQETPEAHFDATLERRGTGQENSSSSH